MKKIIVILMAILGTLQVSAQSSKFYENNNEELIKTAKEKLDFYKKCGVKSPEIFSCMVSESINGVKTVYDYYITDSTISMSAKKITGNMVTTKILTVVGKQFTEILEECDDHSSDYIANMIRLFRKAYLNPVEYKKNHNWK